VPNNISQVRVKSRPDAIPWAEHFEIVEMPVPMLRDVEFLVRNDHLSVGLAMLGKRLIRLHRSQYLAAPPRHSHGQPR